MTSLPFKMKRSEAMNRIKDGISPDNRFAQEGQAEHLIAAMVALGVIEIEPEPAVVKVMSPDMQLRCWPGSEYGRVRPRWEVIKLDDRIMGGCRVLWSSDWKITGVMTSPDGDRPVYEPKP